MYDYDFTEAPVVLTTYPGFRIIEVKGKTFIDLRDPKASALREYLFNYLSNEVDTDTLEDFAHRYPVQFLSDNFEQMRK